MCARSTVSVLLLALAFGACSAPVRSVGNLDFNSQMSSFNGSVRRPEWPRYSLLRDSVNHALAVACIEGRSGADAGDVPDVSERLDTLAAGHVLRMEDGHCEFGFPVIVGDQRTELRGLARRLAGRLQPTVDSIVQAIPTMPGARPGLTFHLLWSRVIDASWKDAWALAVPGEEGPTNVSWLVHPEHGYFVGTNVASLPGHGDFMTTWSRDFSEHAPDMMALTYPLHEAAWRRPITDSGDRALLHRFGFLQDGNVFRGFAFQSDGEMGRTFEQLRKQYAAAVALALEWQGPTHLGLTRSDQFVILLHETAYELFAVLDRSGMVSFPDALRGGGRLSAVADLTSVKLGNEPSADDEAMALYMSNHWHGSSRVVAAFRELVRDQPENADALLYLGMALYDTQQYDEAIAVFSRLETLRDTEEHTLLDWSRIWIGHCHDALGEREAATAVFRYVASTADPGSTMQFGQYGIGHVRAGDWARQRIESPWRWR